MRRRAQEVGVLAVGWALVLVLVLVLGLVVGGGIVGVRGSGWTEVARGGVSAPIASTDFNLFTGTLIPDEGFLVVISEDYDTTYFYSFNESKWSIANIRQSSDYHMDCTYAAAVPGGVVVYGATGVNDADTNTISYYDANERKWSFLASQQGPSARTLVTPVPVNNGEGFLLFGGFKGAYYPPDGGSTAGYSWFNELWYYDLSSQTWELLQPTNQGPPVLCWYAAVPVEPDGLLLYGGGSEFKNIYSDVWYYSYNNNEWTALFSNSTVINSDEEDFEESDAAGNVFPPPRESTGAFYDPKENQLYIWGGWGYDSQRKKHTYLNDLWAFDLDSQTWQEIDQGETVPKGRRGFAYGSNGTSFYIFGGITNDAYGNTIEDFWRYDL